MRLWSWLWLVSLTMGGQAQSIVQTVRGSIVDQLSKKPLYGVSVSTLSVNPTIGAASDSSGVFSFQIPPGRYDLKVRRTGYSSLYVRELLVVAGKENVLQLEMQQALRTLDEVVVESSLNDFGSVRSITVEETMRYAATYYDPARLTLSIPSVTATNDQNNNISVRGNSPNHLRWLLEGSQIVNPNHLSNAGTLSDRPTQNGGGVNILSTQMMGTSQFVYGAFDSRYSNSVGGLFDISLRKGNDEQTETTLQAGLIGLDVANEGPLGKNGASYLANYRFSTVGLLSALGVDFGGESITFQDLAFNLNFPLRNGHVKIFGMGGVSDNEFLGPEDPAEWEEDKDRSDIFAQGEMGAVGGSFSLGVGPGSLSGSLVLSARNDERDQEQRALSAGGSIGTAMDDYGERLLSGHLQWVRPIGRHYFRSGFNANMHFFNIDRSADGFGFSTPDVSETLSQNVLMLSPFAEIEWSLGKLKALTGVQANYTDLTDQVVLDPRLALCYPTGQESEIRISSGSYRQLLSPYLFFIPDDLNRIDLLDGGRDLLKSFQNAISFTRISKKGVKFQTELYWQHFYDVPVALDSDFSVLNYFESEPVNVLVPQGSGDTYGWQTTLEQRFTNNFYYFVGLNLFDASYTTLDGERFDSRFNSNYSINATIGKEMKTKKGNGFGVNVRSISQGGLRDFELQEVQMEPVRLGDPFAFQFEDYFRLDVRLAWKKDKPSYTRTIFLDIQNLTNRSNTAYYQFDEVRSEVVRVEQLGILPILTYRVDF